MNWHHWNKIRRSSFFLPMQWLDAEQRRAMAVLYGLCRLLDDIADNPALSNEEKMHMLDAVEHDIDNIYHIGHAKKEALIPLSQIILTYPLQQRYFMELLAGMRMDVEGQMVKPDVDVLQHYCYRVAGCVGLLSLSIFGHETKSAQNFAVALGYALQLTNILRDIPEDADLGRIYLPAPWLEENHLGHLTPKTLMDKPDALLPICEKLHHMALDYYQQTNDWLDDVGKLRPALMMRETYWSLLYTMKKDRWSYRKEYRASMAEKLFYCGKAMLVKPGEPVQ